MGSFPNSSFSSYADQYELLTNFLVASTPDGTAGVLRNATPSVNECALYWCVQTVTSSVVASTLEEKIVNTVPWRNDPATIPRLNQTMSSNLSLVSNDTFELMAGAALTSTQLFDSFFPFWLSVDSPNSSSYFNVMKGVNRARVGNLKSNPWSLPNNISEHVAQLAKVMSYTVRNEDEDSVEGAAWEQRVMIHVSWRWLILPFFLLLLSGVFLLTTMAKTKEDRLWKNSVLAILALAKTSESPGSPRREVDTNV
jgi:hypothetical protein